MNILITGANGQLGRCLYKAAMGAKDNYFFTDVCDGFAHLDITDITEIRLFVAKHNIRCVVNCAAWTDVDGAESAGAIVEKLNTYAPENLAIAMKEVGGLLIHISTDYVFGSNLHNKPYKEDEACNPKSVYGTTKLRGEQLVAATGVDYIIFRTAWLYSEYGRNFVKTMLTLTSSKKEIKVVCDQKGTPTYALDLAEAIVKIVSEQLYKGQKGIYNYTDEGQTTWHEFAQTIAIMAGNTTCKVLPCTTEEFPSKAVRPSYSVLDKTKSKQTFALDIPIWQSSLHRCLDNLLQTTTKNP